MHLFLINEEEVGHLAEVCNLGGKREVVDVLQCIVELLSFVSAVLELPEVVLCVPWALSLIMIRENIQWSTILTPVPRDDAYDVWIGLHNDPGVTGGDASPGIVGDDAGNVVSPAMEIEA